MKTSQNSLLVHSNQPIQFENIDASVVRDAVEHVMNLSRQRIRRIIGVPAGKQTVQNTLVAMDALSYDLSDLQNKLQLITATYADDSTRNAADQGNNRLSLFFDNRVVLNEALYQKLKQFGESAEMKILTKPQKKFLSDWMITFEKNGMKLSAEQRKVLDAINKKIIDLSSSFDRNIAESKDSVVFTAEELKGVPAATIEPWKRDNGTYTVYVDGPNALAISQYAELGNTRRIMTMHYNNRAYPANIEVLDSLLYYRNIFASHLGFKSYATYALEDKMAKSPANVWAFEDNLVTKLHPRLEDDLNELKTLKHELHPDEGDTIHSWDIAYYTRLLLDKKYHLNTDALKQYFEMNQTIKGMFLVYETLFGLQIRETHDVPVWFKGVRSFEMLVDGKKVGTFYLDLYPRKNKYTHFACFPISQYRKAGTKEVLPVAALVCNFPKPTASEPSLLDHREVTTIFHEFGHLVHFLLGHNEIASQNSFAVKPDFVEAPSQFLENWTWEYAALKLFAKNYKTGEVLPESLFQKLKQSRMAVAGIYYTRQLYYGMLDFTYEDRYDEVKSKGVTGIEKELYTLNAIPYPEGSNFICSFGHLSGYGANYYGYLWSLVYAQDMFSVFQKNGIMDPKTGLRYRKDILEKGASENELNMVETFLGRKPNSEAFLKSLGIP